MSVVLEKTNNAMTAGSTWGYVERSMDACHEDFKYHYAGNNAGNKKIKLDDKYWQECYVDQLKQHDLDKDAEEFVALEFLKWAIDGISKNNSETIYVPAINEFYQHVNNELRVHLGKMMADQSDSYRYSLLVVPSIDWSDCEKYRRFSTTLAESQRKFQFIGRVLADEVLHEPEATDVTCQYIMHDSLRDIIGINYHFTPSV